MSSFFRGLRLTKRWNVNHGAGVFSLYVCQIRMHFYALSSAPRLHATERLRSESFKPMFAQVRTLFYALFTYSNVRVPRCRLLLLPSLPSNVSRNEEHRLLTYSFIYSADIILLMIRKVNYWLIYCSRGLSSDLPESDCGATVFACLSAQFRMFFHTLQTMLFPCSTCSMVGYNCTAGYMCRIE
jgi:hypothetical protein